MRIHRILSVAALAAMSAGAGMARGGALTIDNFEEGAFSLQTEELLVEGIQTELSAANVISGQRRVHLSHAITPSEPTSVNLSLTDADDAAAFVRPSSGAVPTRLSFIYEFDTALDLTAGGVLDRLVVTYSEVTPLGFSAPFNRVRLTSGINSGDVLGVPGAGAIQGSGETTFAFSGAPFLDFTQITRLELLIETQSDMDTTVLVSHFAAVPEPTAALLVGIGILAIGVSGRRVGSIPGFHANATATPIRRTSIW